MVKDYTLNFEWRVIPSEDALVRYNGSTNTRWVLLCKHKTYELLLISHQTRIVIQRWSSKFLGDVKKDAIKTIREMAGVYEAK